MDHETALTDLISLAQRRGSLATEDIRRVLPIDRMTVEDLSYVLARLEQAGIDIEIDPSLLLPDDKTAAKGAAPIAKHDETGVSAPMPEGRQRQTGIPASADAPVAKNHTARPSNPAASPPMLPWILAFAIVVLAVFAAFAF